MTKIEIHLSDDEQQELTRIVSSGNHSARLIRRAQILLKSSADKPCIPFANKPRTTVSPFA
jgi:hypothetical protein